MVDVAAAIPPQPVRRWARLRVGAGRLGLVLFGLLLGAYAVLLAVAHSRPDRAPWHQLRLDDRPDHQTANLETWLAHEAQLFEEMERQLGGLGDYPPASRFDPSSPTHPSRFSQNWNRSFVLEPSGAERLGTALLLHGLSDSPYSLRSVGAGLARAGFRVVALRLPGHGWAPTGIAHVTVRDWRRAVDLAFEAIRAEERDQILVVGYSNGAALGLDLTLRCLAAQSGHCPDRLVFLSPAFAFPSLAEFARWLQVLSHLPGLDALMWEDINPEFDPFKYNSFPINGIVQAERLAREVERGLSRLEREGRLGELPPVLTIQSVVDATVPPVASLRRLYTRVHHSHSALVLFDANHAARTAPLLGDHVDDVFETVAGLDRFPFATTLVTNAAPGSLEVVARSRAPNEPLVEVEALGLAWPANVSSLSHVAIPFPPEDPVYGVVAGDSTAPLPFGLLEPRGERDLTLVPAGLLGRQRWNPFYRYVEARILAFASGNGHQQAAPPEEPTVAPELPPTSPSDPAPAAPR